MHGYIPTPRVKGRTIKLCVLTRWDFNFYVRSSPLRGVWKGVWLFFPCQDCRGRLHELFPACTAYFIYLFIHSFIYWFSFKWRSACEHRFHSFMPKISPQWLSELRRLWASVPWQGVYELVSLISSQVPIPCLDSIVSSLRLRCFKCVSEERKIIPTLHWYCQNEWILRQAAIRTTLMFYEFAGAQSRETICFEEKGEPTRIRTHIPLFYQLTALTTRPNRLTSYRVVGVHQVFSVDQSCWLFRWHGRQSGGDKTRNGLTHGEFAWSEERRGKVIRQA